MKKKIIMILVVSTFFFTIIPINVTAIDSNITEDDFFLKEYEEKASIGENHVLKVGYGGSEVFKVSDVSYRIVGSDSDISEFTRCVDISYRLDGKDIVFTGNVKEWGVYNVDIQPIVKGLTIEKFAWWNSSWQKKINCYVDGITQIHSNLDNFPVLIYVNNATFNASCQNDFDDVRIVVDNTTVRPSEIDTWNYPAVWIWANLSLTFGVKNYFQIYFDNPSAVALPDATINATWDSDYACVFHFSETSGSHHDSTVNGHMLTVNSIQEQGLIAVNLIGRADDFEATASNYLTSDAITVDENNTLSYYTKIETLANYLQSFDMVANDGFSNIFYADGHSYHTGYANAPASHANGGVYYIACADDNINPEGHVWINGRYKGSATYNNAYDDGGFWVGKHASGRYFDGLIDEVRVSNIVRSTYWNEAEYNTIVNTSTFVVWGTTETVPISASSVKSNASNFNILNNSRVYSCNTSNFSCYISNDYGNVSTVVLSLVGHQSVTFENILNQTVQMNFTDMLGLNQTYKLWINSTESGGTINNSWVNFSTYEICYDLSSYIKESDSMDVSLTLTPGFLMLILWFFAIYLVLKGKTNNIVATGSIMQITILLYLFNTGAFAIGGIYFLLIGAILFAIGVGRLFSNRNKSEV